LSLEARKSGHLSDPGAELIDRARGVWDQFGRIVIGVLAGIAVIAVLYVFWTRSRATNEAAAATRMAEATALFWQGEYARSRDMARQIAEEFGSTPSGADAHRLMGDNAHWTGDYAAAITEYRAYLQKEKTGLLADAARRSLAYSLESAGQNADAAKEYEGLVGKFDRESSAEFLAASARCHLALGERDAAIKSLRRLLNEFADTSQSTLARIRLAELETAG
jgi:tetratricopeptide (TPR) repeat protein